jgi:hypothetical protein
MYLFICSLFHYAFSVTKTTQYSIQLKGDKGKMNWKEFGRNWSRPDFKELFWPLSGGTDETMKHISQVIRSPVRDLNPLPPEYEAGVLTTRP